MLLHLLTYKLYVTFRCTIKT